MLTNDCGWKDGDRVITRLEKKLSYEEQEQTHLTPTGLLMEGVITTLRLLFAERPGGSILSEPYTTPLSI
jgi:hypothetical protein